MIAIAAVAALSLALIARPVTAQAGPSTDHGEDHVHRNHVAVLAGGMTPLSAKSETSFALGIDYVRSLGEAWGIGVGADFTFGDHKRAALFAVGATFRPVPALRFGTGPGFELVEKQKSDGHIDKHAYFVWFVSAYYEFHVGSVAIGPLVILDFVGETKTNLTYGISVGTGF